MAFPKGKSGNPGGRPAGSGSLTEHLRVYLNRKNPFDATGRTTYREALITKLVHKAIGGDAYAIKEVFDRVDGKPAQVLIGDPTKPLSIHLQWGSSPEWLKK